ncbi:MAG: acetyl-CoA carboxylase biotin carboxylase subunit [Candidatus Heimdallarchaeaceae archaeon]
MLKKILIANRGEIAVRIIRACKLMNIKTVAIFTVVDSQSLHVKLADEAYCIGSGSVNETYLNIDKIIKIAKKAKCDAIHPGYGFLSENSEFARKVRKSKIVFIGPSPEVIDLLGDKVKARSIACKVGISVVPGSKGYVETLEEAKAVAEEIGYPIIIKAAFGGGGKGMEIVNSPETLEIALLGAQSVAENFFGNKSVFIEKYIESPRHIEIQFIGDSYGNVIHLGDRECSIQRSHQKLIEEAPSFLTEQERNELGEKVCKMAKELGYVNAGTAEFLYKDGQIYFNEVNPRIQVEHPVTEMVTGIDLVVEQIRVAGGLKISYFQDEVKINGSAIEFRINAEDPKNFLPKSGKIEQLIAPSIYHVRFDTFVFSSYNVSNEYDSLLGKLIVWGRSRNDAIERAKLAFNELTISGITTNIDFHKTILETKEFEKRIVSTDFIEKASIKEKIEENEEIKVAALFAFFYNIIGDKRRPIKAEQLKEKKRGIFNLWKQRSKLEQTRNI